MDRIASPAAVSFELWSTPGARPVLIRPLVAADAPLLAAFVGSLAPASRYQRFQMGLSELSGPLLERLMNYDAARELALLATAFVDGRTVAVGEARYALVDAAPGAREFALVVADPLRRRGLGARLLRRLVEHAARTGVARLYGDVLVDNAAMLGLGRHLGFAIRRHPSDARLLRVQRNLNDPAPLAASPRAEVLT